LVIIACDAVEDVEGQDASEDDDEDDERAGRALVGLLMGCEGEGEW
jgi:hypothetical protein